MSLNLQAKDTFFIFDEYGMLVVKSDELSWRDSVGRTVLAWIAYGKPKELHNAIEGCWRPEGDKDILFRHPHKIEKASRDHVSYFFIYKLHSYPHPLTLKSLNLHQDLQTHLS